MTPAQNEKLDAAEAALWQTIVWALATFPDESIREQAIHLVKEAQELEGAEPGEVAEELADCLMLASLIVHRLYLLAVNGDVDIVPAILKKLAKNKTRRWVRTPDGDYQHVPESLTVAEPAAQVDLMAALRTALERR
jgi:hypothetical protein